MPCITYSKKLGLVFTASSIFYTGQEGSFINIFENTHFRKGVLPILRRLRVEKYPLFLVCNVGEVMEGHYSVEELHSFYRAIQDFLLGMGIAFTQIYYECNLRSGRALPSPQMFKEICSDFHYKPANLLVIGRDYQDYQAAHKAFFDYWHGYEFFNTLVPKRVYT